MTTFNVIDLSKLPSPSFIEEQSTEDSITALKAEVASRYPAIAATLDLESEPITKIIEVMALQLATHVGRINQTALAVLLPYATGDDLDQIGARFRLTRHIITAADDLADPPIAEILESDDAFRIRIRISPLGYSTAGPEGAYRFHALSAAPTIKDALAISPAPNDVTVTIVSHTGDGSASDSEISAVETALGAATTRPIGDQVTVQSAVITPYDIVADITLASGPDAAAVETEIHAALQAYADSVHIIGGAVRLEHLYAALTVEGVMAVTLTSPDAAIAASETAAPYLNSITLTQGGV